LSTIFSKNASIDLQPRQDATIRIRYYRSTDPKAPEEYQWVQLLEFHPDFSDRIKCRSEAYVRWELWMTHHAYKRAGVGYLEPSEQYVPLREFMIHEDDRRELMNFCAKYRDHGPLIIHPCPRPYPQFTKGERVTVHVPEGDENDSRSGALATVAEDSSDGGWTMVTFDIQEYNRGTDGQLHPAINMPSASLRLASDLVRSAEYNSLVIVPWWRFYEAVKAFLAELEVIPPDATPVDWAYIGQQKAKLRKEIREFETRFPDYKGV